MLLKSARIDENRKLVYEILSGISTINDLGAEVKFIWVPSHIGLPGNEAADLLANEVHKDLNADIVPVDASLAQFKKLFAKNLRNGWVDYLLHKNGSGWFSFNACGGALMRKWPSLNRRFQCIVSRLLVSSKSINWYFGEGLCEFCEEEVMDVAHYLAGCVALRMQRYLSGLMDIVPDDVHVGSASALAISMLCCDRRYDFKHIKKFVSLVECPFAIRQVRC